METDNAPFQWNIPLRARSLSRIQTKLFRRINLRWSSALQGDEQSAPAGANTTGEPIRRSFEANPPSNPRPGRPRVPYCRWSDSWMHGARETR